ncbi:hypothetical protein HPB50_011434 [Hyalomma asiaticum]|uniref:Uncharacterized protein n=1 Tax=Hyalomma asiaticum TaxID=266040 RepID=A0ACB7SL42_HYAAI|nr:hypothetical protein HPB50_011434 [Hyalomma asiaticum]
MGAVKVSNVIGGYTTTGTLDPGGELVELGGGGGGGGGAKGSRPSDILMEALLEPLRETAAVVVQGKGTRAGVCDRSPKPTPRSRSLICADEDVSPPPGPEAPSRMR